MGSRPKRCGMRVFTSPTIRATAVSHSVPPLLNGVAVSPAQERLAVGEFAHERLPDKNGGALHTDAA